MKAKNPGNTVVETNSVFGLLMTVPFHTLDVCWKFVHSFIEHSYNISPKYSKF